MKSHITSDIKECSASWRQPILTIYNSLTILSLPHEGLPENFDDKPTVNVYEAHGGKEDDWKQYLKDNGQAWIVTPLHYLSATGSRYIRKASGGGRWDDRTGPLKQNVDVSWHKRKYRLDTKEGTALPTYTMFEYSPAEDKDHKPSHALCRITVDNKNNASSKQREGKEIYHTDSKNGDKHKTSLSHESMQQGSGNFENTRASHNLQVLKGTLRELDRQGFSEADIQEALFQIKSEKIPAESPNEHSTQSQVSNARKRRCCTDTNTMEADTSTKSKEQTKVEMFKSNLYQEKPTNLRHDTNRKCSKFEEKSSNHQERNSPGGYCTTYHDASYNLDDLSLEEKCDLLDNQVWEPNAYLEEPNDLCHNFKANSTEPKENRNQLPIYDQNTNAPGPSTRNYAAIEGWLDHQMFEPNADVQVPNYLSHNFKAYSTKPTQNMNHIPSYNQNIIAPGSSTIKDATTDPLIVDPLEKQLVPLFSTDYEETRGWWNHQMFEANADVQGPNYLSNNFNVNSIEPTEIKNHIPSYNQNIISPARSPSNDATTEPGNLLQIPYDTVFSGGLDFHLLGDESIQDCWDWP